MMRRFFYGIILQWKMDLRSKNMLITCYLVPLLFFVLVGEIFLSVMPWTKETLIPTMTIMGVCMGAVIGMPPSLGEIYRTDIRKMYKAGQIPMSYGVLSSAAASLIHLMILSGIICLSAPVIFDVSLPEHLAEYFGKAIVFAAVSLSIGPAIGCGILDQAKIPMVSQMVFLPSIMLSGIMFPAGYLPKTLRMAGGLFPASWAYRWITGEGSFMENFLPMCLIFAVMCVLCAWRLRSLK